MSELLLAAKKVRERAYAPYSRYPVGAAIRDERGVIHVGCNIENVSYPVGICAERNAVAHLIADGGKEVRAIALVTRDGGTPCGLCLQTLLEFAPHPADVEVVCAAEDGTEEHYTLQDLIPKGFRSTLQ